MAAHGYELSARKFTVEGERTLILFGMNKDETLSSILINNTLTYLSHFPSESDANQFQVARFLPPNASNHRLKYSLTDEMPFGRMDEGVYERCPHSDIINHVPTVGRYIAGINPSHLSNKSRAGSSGSLASASSASSGGSAAAAGGVVRGAGGAGASHLYPVDRNMGRHNHSNGDPKGFASGMFNKKPMNNGIAPAGLSAVDTFVDRSHLHEERNGGGEPKNVAPVVEKPTELPTLLQALQAANVERENICEVVIIAESITAEAAQAAKTLIISKIPVVIYSYSCPDVYTKIGCEMRDIIDKRPGFNLQLRWGSKADHDINQLRIRFFLRTPSQDRFYKLGEDVEFEMELSIPNDGSQSTLSYVPKDTYKLEVRGGNTYFENSVTFDVPGMKTITSVVKLKGKLIAAKNVEDPLRYLPQYFRIHLWKYQRGSLVLVNHPIVGFENRVRFYLQELYDDYQQKPFSALTVGVIGAGKSSFINSCGFLATGVFRPIGNDGSSSSHVTTQMHSYPAHNYQFPFNLWDTVGLTSSSAASMNYKGDEWSLIFDGGMPMADWNSMIQYYHGPDATMTHHEITREVAENYRAQNPGVPVCKDVFEAVLFVMSYSDLENLDQCDTLRKQIEFIEQKYNYRIVVAITRMDLSPFPFNDVRQQFYDLFGQRKVLPLVNYCTQNNPTRVFSQDKNLARIWFALNAAAKDYRIRAVENNQSTGNSLPSSVNSSNVSIPTRQMANMKLSAPPRTSHSIRQLRAPPRAPTTKIMTTPQSVPFSSGGGSASGGFNVMGVRGPVSPLSDTASVISSGSSSSRGFSVLGDAYSAPENRNRPVESLSGSTRSSMASSGYQNGGYQY
ncbi:Interferon-induced protein 44-like [Chytridiales sp. JEL 0842]|nr:Interferon-induced protein 44-like [Chytridiales sp. JEL 0842]